MAATDWKAVAAGVQVRMRDDRASLTAAGVGFYAFLSLVPALAAAVSVYGLIADPSDVDDHVQKVFDVLPEDARQVLVSQLSRIVDSSPGTLGASFAVAIIVALWSASRALGHLLDAIGRAYGAPKSGVVRRRLTAVGVTVGMLVASGAALAAFAVLPDQVTGAAARWAVRLGLWAALAGLALLGLEFTYRFGAGRHARSNVAGGSLLALVLVVLLTVGMDVYVANFGSYNATYGTLAGVVVLMLWLHLGALIVIAGAYVNAGLHRASGALHTAAAMGEHGTGGSDSDPLQVGGS